MDREPRKTRPAAVPDGREARLKAALKANIARRKAQEQARAAATDDTGNGSADPGAAPDPRTGTEQD